MANISTDRITFGTFLGVIMIPFQGLGLIGIYFNLIAGGRIYAMIIVTAILHAVFMAAAFHMSYAYIACGWRLLYQVGKSNLNILQMMYRFNYYWAIILIIIGIEIVTGSAMFSWLIIKKNTLYPKWMAFFSPVLTLFYTYFIILLIPYPLGGYLAPHF